MIVVFGKGKVGTAVANLLSYLWKAYVLMDDHDRDDEKLIQADTIMVTPWLPQNHILYKKYKKKCTGEMDLMVELRKEFFWTDKQFPNVETIGITGTNGKSTTSWIVYNLFKNLFVQQNIAKPVYISGNFWTPISAVLLEVLQKNITEVLLVLEVSSFMLYACKSFTFDYSILTNIDTDHLDWHKNFDEYIQCKQQIIKQTTKTAYTLASIYTTLERELQIKTQIFDSEFDLCQTQFLGKHNQYNCKAADLLVKQYYLDHHFDFSQEAYKKVLKEIVPLDHRMKLVKVIKSSDTVSGQYHEIKIYDDGICTSAHALRGALSCFDIEDKKNCSQEKIVLIAGGYDKGEEYDSLAQVLKKKVAFFSLLGDTWKNKFLSIAEQENIPYQYSDNLEQAVISAIVYAQRHTISVVLFSPWSASFDMFKNVYDRCEQFEKIIIAL